jgi:hypothetical protein
VPEPSTARSDTSCPATSSLTASSSRLAQSSPEWPAPAIAFAILLLRALQPRSRRDVHKLLTRFAQPTSWARGIVSRNQPRADAGSLRRMASSSALPSGPSQSGSQTPPVHQRLLSHWSVYRREVLRPILPHPCNEISATRHPVSPYRFNTRPLPGLNKRQEACLHLLSTAPPEVTSSSTELGCQSAAHLDAALPITKCSVPPA